MWWVDGLVPTARIATAGLSAGGGGLVCRRLGRRRSQGSGFHMLYWIPLEFWGWIYIGYGGVFSALALATFVRRAFVGGGLAGPNRRPLAQAEDWITDAQSHL